MNSYLYLFLLKIRNLLRLHRALQFISQFLNEVTKLDENENTNSTAIKSYEKTLMQYHSWVNNLNILYRLVKSRIEN